MAIFAIVAVLLVLVALVIILRPLLRAPRGQGIARDKSNLQIHRDQFAELERDLASGALNAASYEQAKTELERRVLEEDVPPAEVVSPPKPGKATPIAIAVLLPVAAALLYLYLGNLQGIVPPAPDPSSVTASQFEAMTAKLAARMKTNPKDAEGWKMLGRAYRAMERYGEANAAYRKSFEINPNDVDLLGDFAESLALGAGRSMAGEPTQLLDRALKLDPNNTKILALSGSAAFERKDYKAAVRYWETILKLPGVDAELGQALQKGIAESKSRMSGKPAAVVAAGKEKVSGEVSLAAAVQAGAAPDDTVFVFARATSGPRMPLAITKIRVRDLPYRFAFDDTSAMMPDMKISAFPEIVIGARVSKSGSATPAPGDLEGASGPVKPGQSGIQVSIDRQAAAKP
jgi:cytochrome c-type biogenesis protein CcmH